MVDFVIDFSRVKEPNDPQWFMPMMIAEAEPAVLKGSGNGAIALRLMHPELGEVRRWQPVQGFDSRGEALARFALEALRAVGFTIDDVREALARQEILASNLSKVLAGRVVLVELGLDTYNGREHIVARRLLPATATRLPKDWTPPKGSSKRPGEPITLTLTPGEIRQLGGGS